MNKEILIRYVKSKPYIYKKAVSFRSSIVSVKKKNHFARKIIIFFQNKRISSFKNISVLKYQKAYGRTIDLLEDKIVGTVFIPQNVPSRNYEKKLQLKSPSIYCTEIRNATIIGGSNVIISDSYYLNDKFDLAYKNEFNFESGPVYRYTNSTSIVELDKHQKRLKSGIYLVGEGSNNFYHWIFDIMSRVLYINQIDKYASLPFIIDKTVSRHSTCLKMLKCIDKNHHPIILVDDQKTYSVNRLIYISPTTWSNVYQSKANNEYCFGRYIKPQFVIDEYRRIMIPQAQSLKTSTDIKKKLFIIRPNNNFKRLVNEQQLCKIAEKYGFIPYEPSSDTIFDQINTFNNADYIIAASGAALVNLMWCKPNCKVICVSPLKWNDYNYSTLAYLSGANCIYMDGTFIDDIRHTVDEYLFEDTLKKLLNE